MPVVVTKRFLIRTERGAFTSRGRQPVHFFSGKRRVNYGTEMALAFAASRGEIGTIEEDRHLPSSLLVGSGIRSRNSQKALISKQLRCDLRDASLAVAFMPATPNSRRSHMDILFRGNGRKF
jgi:hypothetical protein